MFTSDYSDVTQVTGGQETTKTKTHPTSRHGTLPLEAQVLSTVALAMNNTEENSEVSFLGGVPQGSHWSNTLPCPCPSPPPKMRTWGGMRAKVYQPLACFPSFHRPQILPRYTATPLQS